MIITTCANECLYLNIVGFVVSLLTIKLHLRSCSISPNPKSNPNPLQRLSCWVYRVRSLVSSVGRSAGDGTTLWWNAICLLRIFCTFIVMKLNNTSSMHFSTPNPFIVSNVCLFTNALSKFFMSKIKYNNFMSFFHFSRVLCRYLHSYLQISISTDIYISFEEYEWQ